MASSRGTLAISDHHYDLAKARLLGGEDAESEPGNDASWVGPAIREWHRRYRAAGEAVPSPAVTDDVETDRGAPETPGWDALERGPIPMAGEALRMEDGRLEFAIPT